MPAQEKNPDLIDWEVVGRFTLLAVATIFVAGLWISWHPEWGEWTRYARPVPYAVGGLMLIVAISKGLSTRRKGQAQRMAGALVPIFGNEWDTHKDFSAAKFRKGVPQKIRANYPNTLPDADPLFRLKVEETTRQRMGADKVKSNWDLVQGKVSISSVEFKNKIDQEVARRQDRAQQRVSNIISNHLRAEVSISEMEWNSAHDKENGTVDVLTPEKFRVKYPETATITAYQKRTLEIKLALKLGGRWDIVVNGRDDSLTVRPRYEFPDMVRHPGPELYTKETPFGMLYYCVDESGNNRGWKIGQGSNNPHTVVVGPTGGGKTTFIRSILTGAVMQGIPVYGCDPKRVELRPFQDFPGVGGIASSPQDIAQLIADMFQLMMERYEIIEHYPDMKTQFYPIVFIIDELMILSGMAAKVKAEQKRLKIDADKLLDPMGTITELLALARTASVHLVIGVQRPDASLFGTGARDNLRHRVSLMRLSREGAQMMWDNQFTGLDLPMKQGRCTANPDGENPIEAQTYWISEPGAAKGEDKKVLDAIAAVAAKKFENFNFPIDKEKYALKPGELSKGARRMLDQMDIPLGVLPSAEPEVGAGNDAAERAQEVLMQAVNAGSLVQGDTIDYDGNPALVREVDSVGDAEDDEISLLLDIDGQEEYLTVGAADVFDREVSLEDSLA